SRPHPANAHDYPPLERCRRDTTRADWQATGSGRFPSSGRSIYDRVMHKALVVAIAVMAACEHGKGGGAGSSGIPPDTLFTDLDDGQLTDLCEFVIGLIEPRTVDCPTGGQQ